MHTGGFVLTLSYLDFAEKSYLLLEVCKKIIFTCTFEQQKPNKYSAFLLTIIEKKLIMKYETKL